MTGISSNKYNVDITAKDYAFLKLSVNQTTDFTTSDHVKWDIVSDLSGNDIFLDTTTAYSNATNVASIGRVTLKGGKKYRIRAVLNSTFSSSGYIRYSIYNSDTNTELATFNRASTPTVTDSNDDSVTPESIAILSPTTDTRIEVRFITGTNVIAINKDFSFLEIESIEAFIPINRDKLVAIFEHQETSGTGGGTGVATTWTKRKLNTTIRNDQNFATVASDVLTLPAGKYTFRGFQSFHQIGYCKVRLRDTTDSISVSVGDSDRAAVGQSVSCKPFFVSGIITISNTKNFEFQYYIDSSTTSSDLGVPHTIGEIEVYARLEIEKIG